MSVAANPAPPAPRLLLVKLGAIGDVVMAIPAAYAMHQRGYAIDWLCATAIAPVLQLYPWINVISVDEAPLLRGSKLQTLRALLALWRKLRGPYDLVATLYYDTRYKLLTLPIRAHRKLLLSRLDRNLTLLPGRHHTDEYARILLAQLGEDFGNTATPFQLPPIPALGLPPTAFPKPAGKARIVLIPAGARNVLRDDPLRRWPIESYVAVAHGLLARGHEVILAGGPDDSWAGAAFDKLPVRNLIGKLTLIETLSLLDSAAVTITHDTGPLHLAGLTSTAIVAIFGPTDPHGRLPQRTNTVALWGGEGFACRPCFDGRDYAPCVNNACMQQITPAMVVAETEALLTATTPLLPRIRVPKHTAIPAPQPLLTLR